ncbi:Na+/H+ antiporter subunit E [Kocuria rosea]|uniref:Sodium:proton antiporter n=1 Tax=Kocuria rosea TaxID=1275 RepID=A0A4R5YHY1_KOCRO|nr:Na+/H+ antiporter subunit E [Kocuria rosea]TDL44506.1 sodium:proton antiporter [Kocuria rosea]
MKWLTWPLRLIGFLLWYAWELVLSNVAVTRDVLTPGQGSSPIVIRYRTRCRSEFETVLLSVLISLTPGTLTLATVARPPEGSHSAASDAGAGDDGAAGTEEYDIFVHAMYSDGPQDARSSLQEMETHMLNGIRPGGGPR